MAEEVTKAKVGKKKTRRSVPLGQVHIQATFNNTIISFADSHGNVLAASSAGACGFRGSKKGTAYAAQIATDKAAEIAKSLMDLSADVADMAVLKQEYPCLPCVTA
jgi:small subunit ribosomal protein S11